MQVYSLRYSKRDSMKTFFKISLLGLICFTPIFVRAQTGTFFLQSFSHNDSLGAPYPFRSILWK